MIAPVTAGDKRFTDHSDQLYSTPAGAELL